MMRPWPQPAIWTCDVSAKLREEDECGCSYFDTGRRAPDGIVRSVVARHLAGRGRRRSLAALAAPPSVPDTRVLPTRARATVRTRAASSETSLARRESRARSWDGTDRSQWHRAVRQR